ncbi:YxeA family protein [Alkalihalobacillus sp. NPDC078783]
MMKKVGITFILVIVAAVAGYMVFTSFQEDDYYVKIVDEGVEPADAPPEATHRNYETLGITEDGDSENIKFLGMKKLRMGAYLTVTMRNGEAKTYQEVNESDVPEEIKRELDEQS